MSINSPSSWGANKLQLEALKAFAHQSHRNRVDLFPDCNGLAIEENPSKLQIQDSTDSLIGFLIGAGSGVDQKRIQKRNKNTPAPTAQANHGFDLTSSKTNAVNHSLTKARCWHGDNVKPGPQSLLDCFFIGFHDLVPIHRSPRIIDRMRSYGNVRPAKDRENGASQEIRSL